MKNENPLDQLARLDNEVGIQPKPPQYNEQVELLIGACRAYDRLSIVMDHIMEYWLEGNANPPKELINAYYDAKDDVGEHINVGRIHEQIVSPNSEFFEKINLEFGLDNPPRLF
jgi:hypothetical protein